MNKAFSLAMALAIFPCLLSAQEFRVKPLFKGNAYANFVHYQGQLHFTRSNGNYGEWYKLEANGDTTFVDMGLNFDKIESLTVIDSCLFFGGRTSPDPYNYGIEPYCYCGDTARLIHNLTTGGATINQRSSYPGNFTSYNGKVVFMAKAGPYPFNNYSIHVWSPDTSLLTLSEAYSDSIFDYVRAHEVTKFNGNIYFRVIQYVNGSNSDYWYRIINDTIEDAYFTYNVSQLTPDKTGNNIVGITNRMLHIYIDSSGLGPLQALPGTVDPWDSIIDTVRGDIYHITTDTNYPYNGWFDLGADGVHNLNGSGVFGFPWDYTGNYGNKVFIWREDKSGFYAVATPQGSIGGDLYTVFGTNPQNRLHLWDTIVPSYNHINQHIYYKDHLFFISGFADSSTHPHYRYLMSHFQDTGLYGYQNQELKWHLDEDDNYIRGQYANFTESNGKVYFNGYAWNNRGDTAGTGNHMYVLYQCQNSTSNFAQTSCNIYTSPSGKQWNTSGVYQDTIENYSGCDSIMTISLTISTPAVQVDQINACDSLTWINGVTYTSNNNTAIDTLTNQFGCDSIVTLDLTINNSDNTTDQITACNSYTWINGVTYTSSNNIARDTLQNSQGCDSVVSLDLTIYQSDSVIENISACDTYTWIDGNTYTSSTNTVSHTLTNNNGCDSVVYLDLVMHYSENYTDSIETCDSYTWIDGNTYTSSNNTASVVLQNSHGCDSTINLHLTINNSTSSVDVINTCGIYTWIDGNTYTASNNTAIHILTTSKGCDSVINLDLTITKIDRFLTAAASSLIANEAGASYQWLDCNNGFAAVPGETGQTFVASGNGSYAVEITKNSCIDTSFCYVVVFFIGIDEASDQNFISYYPNPTSGKVELTSSFALNNAVLNVSNNKGKLIKRFPNIEGTNFSFSLEDYPEGIYYLTLIYEGQTIHSKILKQK